MQFIVLSREKARKFSYTNIDKPTIIISITDVGSEPNRFNHNSGILNVLHLQFNDVDIHEPFCITETDACKIVNFVSRYLNKAKQIVVHCEAGVSRSAGVCAALMKVINGSDFEIFDNPHFCPNMSCYRMVLTGFNSFDENEADKNLTHNIDVWRKMNLN